MDLALVAVALAAGYAAGRARLLKRARRRAWANVYLSTSTTQTQALLFLALHPLVTVKTALRILAGRDRHRRPHASPLSPRWTPSQDKGNVTDA